MKIVHKIVLANIIHILLMALIFLFAYQNLNLMLAKLRFVEIADDLNASFLETRLAEKNYFLYQDQSALSEIKRKLKESMLTIRSVEDDIVRAIGVQNYHQMISDLQQYIQVTEMVGRDDLSSPFSEKDVREAGRRLREFSSDITLLERKRVNAIITGSENGLFISFGIILVFALGLSHVILFKILKSLNKIEAIAVAISGGQFEKVDPESISGDELGSVLRAVNSMSDELKTREELIIQSKKLESLGILTAGVAHELGNPLNNISMTAQVYLEHYDVLSKDDHLDFMKKVEEETERIRDIVKNLLDFSKTKKRDFRRADINLIVRKTLKLVHNMLHVSNIEVKSQLQEGLPAVYVDAPKIQEVFVNLITNAIQAISSRKGQLHISTRPGQDHSTVEICVEDTGKGIPPDILPNIFDPFFSTKGVDGTGLGLSVSYGIIKNHKGSMKVTSEVGVGTSFVIALPTYSGKDEQDECQENHGDR